MCNLCVAGSPLTKAVVPPSRRAVLGAMGAFSLLGLSAMSGISHAKSPPKPANVLSPDQAIQRLLEGNKRYTSGKTEVRKFSVTRAALVGGQNPYACVLSCADSRVSPELCFDEARGDLFVTRVAGNYVTPDILASLEYGVAALHSPVILVLGHTSCGAVSATVNALEKQAEFPGHIQSIVTALMPAVRAAAAEPHEGSLAQAATIVNIKQNVQRLQEATPVLSKAVQAQKLKVLGGLYHLETGRVEIVA